MENFLLIQFTLDREYDAFIQANIYEFDNLGFEIDDPVEKQNLIKDLPEWEASDLEFDLDGPISYGLYFTDDAEGHHESDRFVRFLEENIEDFTYTRQLIDNSNWEDEWKKSYKSFEVGENILVKPSWEQVNSDRKYIIEIDPKMAFGTGSHETTSLCMEYVEKENFAGKKILDIGCGTGILSILSSKLGAENVDACDIDQLAIESTRENALINKTPNIDVFYSDLFSNISGKYNIIFANILAEILVKMIEGADGYLCEGGRLVLSGIVEGKEKIVEESLKKNNFKLIDKIKKNEWFLISAERSDV